MFSLYEKGVSLVEVLVALMLLGLTVSSLLILQHNSLFATREALWWSHANQVATEVIDRVELNELALSVYLSKNNWLSESRKVTGCIEGDLPCATPSQAAHSDIKHAKRRLEKLPNGRLVIELCSDDVYCVKVVWHDTEFDNCGLPVSDLTANRGLNGDALPHCLVLEF